MTTNVLVLLHHAMERAYAVKVLQRAAGIRCEAVDDIEGVLQRTATSDWDVVLCGVSLKDADIVRLINALSERSEPPDLILTTPDDPALLTAAMRVAHRRGVRVRGYVRGPMNGLALKGLLGDKVSAPMPRAPTHADSSPCDASIDTLFDIGQAEVWYLPQACATHLADIAAAQAVLMWPDPMHGKRAAPRQHAGDTGADTAVKLIRHVLGHASRALGLWREHGFHPSISCPFPLALLELDHCAELVTDALQECGLHPRDLTFELDLSGGRRDVSGLAPALLQLRLQDLEFAVSCGNDGATFATLVNLPVSELKLTSDLLDGVAFDPYVQQMVAGVVNLAKGLDMRVVATAVSQLADFTILRDLGCDFMQGPLVGAAQTAAGLVGQLQPRPDDTLQT
ncbi:EAL domain-containing response regulator [Cupriavidus necator]|uniref:EAL domain-containing response regulator n=1 Tax=Cupriavidus necator TaxID=106590 RepID=UPI00339D73A8